MKINKKVQNVVDLETAKKYVAHVLNELCAFTLSHSQFAKALQIIMESEKKGGKK